MNSATKKLFFFIFSTFTPLTLIVSFILYFKTKSAHNNIPYISEAIEYLPIATFGLAISNLLSIGLYIIKYKYNELEIERQQPSDNEKTVKILNSMCLTIALIQSIGLLGVISFPIHYINNVHLVFSAIYFIFGLFYIILSTLLDFKLYLIILNSKLFVFRVIITVLYTVAILIFQSTNYKEYNNLCALSEILCVFLYFLFFLSFYYEYKITVIGEDVRHYISI